MWFRRDLRVRDLPALAEAATGQILPCFIFDDRLISGGRFVSPARVSFMVDCLRELRASLRDLGADLLVRRGLPEQILPELARDTDANRVDWTADVSPWALGRDRRVEQSLGHDGVDCHRHPGSYIVDEPGVIRSGQGTPYTVFSPFAKAWRTVERRPVEPVPDRLDLAGQLDPGLIPTLEDLGLKAPQDEVPFRPGERAGREAAHAFLEEGLASYADRRNSPAGGSSMLSPYIRWGCLSPLELEYEVGLESGDGPRVFRSELAWREFYAAVLAEFPEVTEREFQPRYRGTLGWQHDDELLESWKQGQTGYPLIDAGMRQLLGQHWMHNRVRMVVASFLTKDLHLDWRLGEGWFMEQLIDGDIASNNGGWQWVASVGTDP
ncbi:MAG: deoxyribodipyrimidine photo-lyase, partial [Acidobacteriota bacterium]